MDLQLNDKTALVTGASVGIGRAIALALAGRGCATGDLGAPRREAAGAGATRSSRRAASSRSLLACDLYSRDAATQLAAQATQGLGRVDILVNNAGGSRSFKDLHVSEEAWQEAITLNFHRPRQLADALVDADDRQRLGPHRQHHRQERARAHQRRVLRQGGDAQLGQGPVAHGRQDGITVNCIAPGRILSEQILRNYSPEYRQWQSDNEIPVGRYGEAQELADLVVFLASPRASYITGTVIPVDGGLRKYQF